MKRKAFGLVLPLAAMLLCAMLTEALAATPAGKVAIVRGKVTAVSEDGQTRAITAKSPIYVNDTISTEANSQAQILFNDETVYTIGPQSDMKIDQFVYDPQKSVGDLVVGATKGSFRMITGSIAKKTPERVKVKTPVATIGIRGTYFAGTFNGAALNTLLVGGAIMLENKAGVSNIRTPGFGSVVKSGAAAPEPPRKFTPQEVKAVLAPTEIKGAPMASAPQGGGSPTKPAGGNSASPAGTTTTAATASASATAPASDPNAPAPAPAPTNNTATAPAPIGATAPISEPIVMPPPPPPTMPPQPPIIPKPQPIQPKPPCEMKDGVCVQTSIVDTSAPQPALSVAPSTSTAPPPPPPPPPPTTYTGFTGKYLAKDGGIVTGTLTGSSTGNSRDYMLSRGGWGDVAVNMSGPVVDLTADPMLFTGSYSLPAQTLWGIGYPAGFSEYDGRGEFGYFESATGNMLMGYAGLPSTSALPTSGIGGYKGIVGNVSSLGSQDASDMYILINWSTGKVFGSLSDKAGSQTFYMGTVNAATKQLSGNVFGKEPFGTTSDFHVGTSPLVYDFFGSGNQGIGGTTTGLNYTYNTGSMSFVPGATASVITAAFGNPQAYTLLRPNNETYNGFVSAITIPRLAAAADNIQNLSILTNTTPGAVNLALDRLNGTAGGTFNATGMSLSTATSHNLAFSFASADSIYIDDNAFVNNYITTSGTVGGTAVTTPATGVTFVGTNPTIWDPIPYDHLTWGYWSAEYSTGATQHNITPGSYWIAGLVTPYLSIPATGTGTYNGYAMGQAYDKTNSILYPITGTSTLTANFGAKTINGTLNMSGPLASWVATVNGSWSATNYFSGTTSATVNGTAIGGTGTMNGAFFDTNAGPAKAVGGNWSVDGTGHLATGIFVGKQ